MVPPPPLSILIPAMLSMGGTEFIVVPDGSHWRGREQAGREGGREGGDRRGQRDRGQDQETTAHNMSQKE